MIFRPALYICYYHEIEGSDFASRFPPTINYLKLYFLAPRETLLLPKLHFTQTYEYYQFC